MATIKDIADKLGVSVSTVSKGLNGASDISESLRQAVLDTAVEMGYSTKRSRKEEHRKLCLLIENMDYMTPDSFGYEIVLGFRQNAFKNKWDIDIIDANAAMQAEDKYDTYLLKNGYCGAFIVGFALEDEWMHQLSHTTMPTVLLDNFVDFNPKVCLVGTDSHEGIEMAVAHLHELGHEKIAFLNGSEGCLVSEQRQEAFEAAMKKAGLKPNPKLMAYGHFVADSAKYHVPGFLKEGATAIVCGNDLIAQGAIDVCASKGLSCPKDISIIGFDDIKIAQEMNPPLTTIRQECNDLGRCAYVMLNSLVNNIPISKTLMRPQLIKRGSTAKVNKNKR